MFTPEFLNRRINIHNRTKGSSSEYGKDVGQYEMVATYWANIAYSKGVKSLRHGSLDAYDVIMIRMRYHKNINKETRFSFVEDSEAKEYQITSLHKDRLKDEIQITAIEMTNTQSYR